MEGLSSETELSKIDLRKNEIEQKYKAKEDELNGSFERERISWGDTDSEQVGELDRKLGDLEEQKNAELQKLDIDKAYQIGLIDRRGGYQKYTNLLSAFIIVLVIVFIVVIGINFLKSYY